MSFFEKSLNTLELPAVLAMLSQQAVGDTAKERALNIALNKITGEWNKELLADLIADLQDSDFAALWQRRLEVCRVFENLYFFYELSEKCRPDIDAFFWFQINDMLQLSARRASGYSEFHLDMKTLRADRPDHGRPSGVPQKDFLSLRLLLLHMDWPLWLYERGRRRLRVLRNRER